MAASSGISTSREDEASLKSLSARRDSVVVHPASFVWTPLANAHREIRVCTIEPGPEGSPVRVGLRTVGLQESVDKYACLSYAWVTENTTHNILLNNSFCRVTQNLHLQLSRLRALGHVQDLWCDYLCIAQGYGTAIERSIQVSRMGEIFSTASQVFLGVDEGGLLLNPSQLEEAWEKLARGSHLRIFECLRVHRLSASNVAVEQMRRILDASFWSRCFTVQETVLAKKAIMVGEWGMIPFSSLVNALMAYDKHRQELCCGSFVNTLPNDMQAKCYQLLSHVSSLRYTRKHLRQGHHGHHLIELLQMFQGLKATRDRDQLFAFWGLARGSLPKPNYECSTETVFIDIARWLLDDTQDLLMLAMGLRPDTRLPSWVPDWSSELAIDGNAWRRRLHCLEVYDSAKDIQCSIRFANSKTLCLQGVKVDKITEVAKQTLTSEDSAEHTALIKSWQTFAHSSTTEQPLSDSFCETMIEGCCPHGSSGFSAANASDIELSREMLIRLVAEEEFTDDTGEFMSIRQNHLTGLWERALFRTGDDTNRRLGLGPIGLQEGDELWVVGGGKSPLVLRPQRSSGLQAYRLVGHAYVNGLMHGRAVEPWSKVQECRII